MNTSVFRFRRAVYPGLMLAGLLMLLACIVPAHAEPAANVHFVSGYVAAKAPSTPVRELAKGDDVFRSERIDTADNGRVQMRFTDGGLVSLMPNSTFTIEEYFHDGGADQDASLVFGLLKGGLRTVTGTIGQVHHDQYELKTPVATLGIRGTEYVAVLRPANTLRVHVGRGKVVITNDQGSLEVPEGHNAIVTLGSAPEFSEQGPQYQATGPRGDRLYAQFQHRQDPHLLNPRANMSPAGTHSFLNLPDDEETGPPPVTPPTTPPVTPPTSPVLPPGTYQIAAMFPVTGPTPVALAELTFDGMGHMSSLNTATFDTGDWQAFNVVTSGSLSWGEFRGTAGDSGSFSQDPITLGSEHYAPYVVGSLPELNVLPISGTLSYSLEGATPARAYNSDGAVLGMGTLDHFTLAVDFASSSISNITFGMQLSMPSNIDMGYEGGTYTGNTVTSFSGDPRDFRFEGNVARTGGCSGCPIEASGFLAGPDAGQAGIVYSITDTDDPHDAHIFGAAGLRRD